MTPTPPPGMWMPTDPSPPLDTAELPNPPEYGSAWTASWRRSSRMGSISSRSWSRNGGGINVVLDGAAIVAHLWSSGNVPNWKWPPYMPIHFVNSNHHWVNIWGRKDKGLDKGWCVRRHFHFTDFTGLILSIRYRVRGVLGSVNVRPRSTAHFSLGVFLRRYALLQPSRTRFLTKLSGPAEQMSVCPSSARQKYRVPSSE